MELQTKNEERDNKMLKLKWTNLASVEEHKKSNMEKKLQHK